MALLWIALTVMIGIFVLVFYKLIKQVKEDKKEPDNNNNPLAPLRMSKKTAPVPRRRIPKDCQVGAGIVSANSGIRNSKVEINITNYPSYPGSTKEQYPDNSRALESFNGNPAETEKRSSDGKSRKRAERVK